MYHSVDTQTIGSLPLYHSSIATTTGKLLPSAVARMQLLKLTRRLRAEHSRRIGSRWSLIRYLAGIRSQGGSRILIHYPASNPDGGKLEGGISSVVRATSDERRKERVHASQEGGRGGREKLDSLLSSHYTLQFHLTIRTSYTNVPIL